TGQPIRYARALPTRLRPRRPRRLQRRTGSHGQRTVGNRRARDHGRMIAIMDDWDAWNVLRPGPRLNGHREGLPATLEIRQDLIDDMAEAVRVATMGPRGGTGGSHSRPGLPGG